MSNHFHVLVLHLCSGFIDSYKPTFVSSILPKNTVSASSSHFRSKNIESIQAHLFRTHVELVIMMCLLAKAHATYVHIVHNEQM